MRALAFALCASLCGFGFPALAQEPAAVITLPPPYPDRHIAVQAPPTIWSNRVVVVPEYSTERAAPAWRTPDSGQSISIDRLRLSMAWQDQPLTTYDFSFMRKRDSAERRFRKEQDSYSSQFRGESQMIFSIGVSRRF
jgi:hypothetical protein